METHFHGNVCSVSQFLFFLVCVTPPTASLTNRILTGCQLMKNTYYSHGSHQTNWVRDQGWTYPLRKGWPQPWAPKSQGPPKMLFKYEMHAVSARHANVCCLRWLYYTNETTVCVSELNGFFCRQMKIWCSLKKRWLLCEDSLFLALRIPLSLSLSLLSSSSSLSLSLSPPSSSLSSPSLSLLSLSLRYSLFSSVSPLSSLSLSFLCVCSVCEERTSCAFS